MFTNVDINFVYAVDTMILLVSTLSFWLKFIFHSGKYLFCELSAHSMKLLWTVLSEQVWCCFSWKSVLDSQHFFTVCSLQYDWIMQCEIFCIVVCSMQCLLCILKFHLMEKCVGFTELSPQCTEHSMKYAACSMTNVVCSVHFEVTSHGKVCWIQGIVFTVCWWGDQDAPGKNQEMPRQ